MSLSSQLPQSLFCAIIAGDDNDNDNDNDNADDSYIDDDTLHKELYKFLNQLGKRDDVLLLPPDYTRFHSQAGKITQIISEYYNCIKKKKESSNDDDNDVVTPPTSFQIMPALGTHAPMTKIQIKKMFGTQLAVLNEERERSSPLLFLEHKWKTDVVTIGHVPNEMVLTATNGLVNEPWPAQLNKLVWEKRKILPPNNQAELQKQKQEGEPHKSQSQEAEAEAEADALVLSIGQVVPHEVMGMANYNKNLFVGVGGLEAINLSHFIGAVYGMENMMGRANNPLRQILNYASEHFLENKLDLWYILTVISPKTGKLKGLFIGNTIDCYMKACELSMKINFTMLNKSPKRIVVYLDEDEFHSTWLGNKAIYRTRMAIADGGELIILAPGVCKFGETTEQDSIIRKYGYVGTPKIMNYLKEEKEQQVGNKDNDGAVAHLIHGSSEDRFRITYCPGPLLNEKDIHQVGFQYGNLEDMLSKYDINTMKDGWNNKNNNYNTSDDDNNDDDDNEFYFIKNPALGLWAVPDRFEKTDATKVDDVDSNNDETSSLSPATKKSKTSSIER
ncbi:hypothetical protein FRACYDRAFT_209324 [Fragilariopsis cylindrus CCMP1102]|uniref:LarA-like N-terminal domain-containing protein n=1 Tax=Fragilariopsis cylindrus CCMP1102 TaxID=635003 RepID=A0A1E7F7Z3_9STRA|nr:hypothetical protein FRACYDRAFT_209324 [Fragilariopsis cylindrus CCMP1102]|eukprot:OEU14224.1 hypothetical protein FRACYDRAFT_209324 [Fragilariopsis cylindrus CCMP1102]